MKHLLWITLLLVSLFSKLNAQTIMSFRSLDSLLFYAENNSYSIKSGSEQLLLAKWQKISAQAAVINFRVPINFNLTDNIEQPVTFLPGEVFGGQPGTFKQVTTGQQYVGNFNIAPQIDIINPASWAKLKSASLNSIQTELNNLIVKKTLFESISATYHNIISMQEQIEITQNNLLVADTLYLNMQNKYSQGIIRQQDLNDAQINKINLIDKLEQLKLSLKQQYLSIKILCDISEDTEILINETLQYNQQFSLGLTVDNQLQYKTSLLKVEQAKADVRTNRLLQLPTLSFVYYDAWQQNSNVRFFDNNVDLINSQYFGLKLTMLFPDVNRYTLTQTSKINQTISLQNAEHSKIQTDLANKQLVLDYEKAYSQLTATKQVYELKAQNYQLAFNQFNASILPPDKLLIAFNDMLVSRLNYSNALSNVLFTKSKIDLNNTIK
ncbi:MAG: TolC family protein [Candidatus Paceibacterota bacterium]